MRGAARPPSGSGGRSLGRSPSGRGRGRTLQQFLNHSGYFWLKQNLATLEKCFSGRADSVSVSYAFPDSIPSRRSVRLWSASGGEDENTIAARLSQILFTTR